MGLKDTIRSVATEAEIIETKATSVASRVGEIEQQAVLALKGVAFVKDGLADPKTGGMSAARGIAWLGALTLSFVAGWSVVHMTEHTPNMALAAIVGSLASITTAALAWRTRSDNSDKPNTDDRHGGPDV